jgi:hypothetical protein
VVALTGASTAWLKGDSDSTTRRWAVNRNVLSMRDSLLGLLRCSARQSDVDRAEAFTGSPSSPRTGKALLATSPVGAVCWWNSRVRCGVAHTGAVALPGRGAGEPRVVGECDGDWTGAVSSFADRCVVDALRAVPDVFSGAAQGRPPGNVVGGVTGVSRCSGPTCLGGPSSPLRSRCLAGPKLGYQHRRGGAALDGRGVPGSHDGRRCCGTPAGGAAARGGRVGHGRGAVASTAAATAGP